MKAEGKNDLADRTKAFALTVIRMTDDLPRTTSAQVLGKQVLRSATSIGANYREASRGRSKPEFIAKIGDCLREAEETGYWLELLQDSRALSPTQSARLSPHHCWMNVDSSSQSLSPFLNALVKTHESFAFCLFTSAFLERSRPNLQSFRRETLAADGRAEPHTGRLAIHQY